MSSVLTALADDVLAIVSPATITAGGTASRVHVPLEELKDLASLKVTVVPRMLEKERTTRVSWQRDYTVDVAVQKRAEDQAAIDALTAFAEQLSDAIEVTPLPIVKASLTTSKIIGPDPGHLREYKVFTAVLSVTYRQMRASA